MWDENFQVYGVRKTWRALKREDIEVARCTVARLMARLGLREAVRGGAFKTTTVLRAALIRPADRRRGPWRDLEAVEFATLEWVHWFNHRRPLEPIGHVPPVEREAAYYRAASESAVPA